MAFYCTLDKIKNAITVFSMLEKGDSVLVGFSGGKDSVVLLHSLKALSKDLGISLTALHVNHNIRGSEAKRDEDFCECFCKKHDIRFMCKNVYAVEKAEQEKLGLEEAARILRYSAFSEVAEQNNITKIATAHTASDNMETVLFNLARGCSAEGLKGIPPVRDNIIRPLIHCTSDEILEYAKKHSLDFVTDSTNSDTAYTRNHIRHNIVPQIKKINPSAEAAVLNMCSTLRTDLDFISLSTKKLWTDHPGKLAEMHKATASRIIVGMYKDMDKNSQLSHVHISDILLLIKKYTDEGCCGEKRLSLPGKTNFVITPSCVYFEKCKEQVYLKQHVLRFGLNEFEETGDAVALLDEKDDIHDILSNLPYLSKNVYKISIHTIVKKTAIAGTITVRCKQPGDVFEFSNMTKKVKKMLNEKKIPLNMRNRLPVFCDSRGIFWIAGFPLRDDVKPVADEESVHIYYLTRETQYESGR